MQIKSANTGCYVVFFTEEEQERLRIFFSIQCHRKGEIFRKRVCVYLFECMSIDTHFKESGDIDFVNHGDYPAGG